jgi:hypothetical protein
MSSGTVVKNAGSHRILHALSTRSCTSRELKLIVGAINSVMRFENEYMMRLVNNGLVEKVGFSWALTPSGQIRASELGPVEEKPTGASPRANSWKEMGDYNPRSDLLTTVRPGADEAMQLPSRIGNRLFYRDGTIKEI